MKSRHVGSTELEIHLLGLKGDAPSIICVHIHEVSDWKNSMGLLGPCHSQNLHLSQLERTHKGHPWNVWGLLNDS